MWLSSINHPFWGTPILGNPPHWYVEDNLPNTTSFARGAETEWRRASVPLPNMGTSTGVYGCIYGWKSVYPEIVWFVTKHVYIYMCCADIIYIYYILYISRERERKKKCIIHIVTYYVSRMYYIMYMSPGLRQIRHKPRANSQLSPASGMEPRSQPGRLQLD